MSGPGEFIAFNQITSGSTDPISLTPQRAAQLRGRDETSIQVDISGTGEVSIEGRLSDTLGWAPILTNIASSGIFRIGVAKEVRLTITSGTPTVNGGVMF